MAHAAVRRAGRLLAMLAIAGGAAGCSLLHRTPAGPAEGRCIVTPPSICPQLKAVAEGQAALRYVAPALAPGKYKKVMISPVTTWTAEAMTVTPATQQVVANYLFNAVTKAVGDARIPMVDQPGAEVVRLQLALSQVSGTAPPILRTISLAVPPARVESTAQYGVTGSYAFVGQMQGEALVSDSVTGTVLTAAIEPRIGGGPPATAAQWQWSGAQQALNAWAAQIARRLDELRSGPAQP
jgi:hypothetical protein